MAVRSFELNEAQSSRLSLLECPPTRRALRRQRQRYAVLGVVAVAVPFVAALVALGVSH